MGVIRRAGIAIFAIGAAALGIAACGGSGEAASTGKQAGSSKEAAETKEATGSSAPAASGSKEVIAFTPTTENNYVAMWTTAVKEGLESKGYTVKFYQNNFEQSEEDQQVAQVLASGAKPAAFIWWPSDNEAGIADVRRLSAVAPIVQTNNKVLPQAEKYVTAFGGVHDYADGVATGELALKMREAFEARGVKPHSPGGNAIIVTYGGGYQAGIDRVEGILAATKKAPFKIIEKVETGFTTEEAYKSVAAVLPKLRSKGIDYVLAVSEFPALGAIQALKEDGYKPGVNVGVVTGNCQTNFNHLVSGEEFGTILQSPTLEGKTVVWVLTKLLTDGGKTKGPKTEYTLPASTEAEPELPEVPAYANYFPLPLMEGGKGSRAANQKMVEESKLWGQTAEELCAK